MITTKDLTKISFDNLVSGSCTFITDGDSSRNAKVGDFIAVNEWDKIAGYTGRCCLVKISVIEKCEDCYIYAVQPCRVEEHKRLPAAVYGEKN